MAATAPMHARRLSEASSRADSLFSRASTSTGLTAADSKPELLDCALNEYTALNVDHILPALPDASEPPSPAHSQRQPATPSTSTHALLPPTSSQARAPKSHLRPRRDTQETRALLTSLSHAHWPASEPEDPIFGRTAPRALSPTRGSRALSPTPRPLSPALTIDTVRAAPGAPLPPDRPRPHSAHSVPRSILRADSRAPIVPALPRAPRPATCVKFARTARIPEEPVPAGAAARASVVSEADVLGSGSGRGRGREKEKESFLRRCFGRREKTRERDGEEARPTISAPMPLARAASMRDMRRAHEAAVRAQAELAQMEREEARWRLRKAPPPPAPPAPAPVAQVAPPARRAGGRRTFWARVSGAS